MSMTEYAIQQEGRWAEAARKALPFLVNQARLQRPVTYHEMMSAVGEGHVSDQNSRHILDPIVKDLTTLSAYPHYQHSILKQVPPLTAIVVRQDGVPGGGVADLLYQAVGRASEASDYEQAPMVEKREILNTALGFVFSYGKWDDVLRELGLEPINPDNDHVVRLARFGAGGGEQEEHKNLKQAVQAHPDNLREGSGIAWNSTQEEMLASGDSLDVSLTSKHLWLGVEVKPASAESGDISRGLFQCVKYLATMEAMAKLDNNKHYPRTCKTKLVLGGELPSSLWNAAQLLGVEVIENFPV